MSDEHVCTGACAPGFHPAVTPTNEYGRAPASRDAERDRLARENVGLHIVNPELRRIAGGCACGFCRAGFEGWL